MELSTRTYSRVCVATQTLPRPQCIARVCELVSGASTARNPLGTVINGPCRKCPSNAAPARCVWVCPKLAAQAELISQLRDRLSSPQRPSGQRFSLTFGSLAAAPKDRFVDNIAREKEGCPYRSVTIVQKIVCDPVLNHVPNSAFGTAQRLERSMISCPIKAHSPGNLA